MSPSERARAGAVAGGTGMPASGGLRLFMPGARCSAPSRSAASAGGRAEALAAAPAAVPHPSDLSLAPLAPPPPPPPLAPFAPFAPATPAHRAGTASAHRTRTHTSRATFSAASQQGRGDCVMAIIDNRALEVGIALCQLPSLAIIITQFGDSVGFAKTLSLVFSRNPVEVLVADTAVDGKLFQTLLRNFRDEITFTSVPRRSFSESLGSQRLHELMSTEESRLEVSSNDRYLCVAAANAVIAFMEGTYNYTLQPRAVRVQYLALENYVEISRLSARALHLIPSGLPQHSSHSHDNNNSAPRTLANPDKNADMGESGARRRSKPSRKSFFRAAQDKQNPPLIPLVDALNHTLTGVGRRLLRSTVLQPLRDPTSIQMRYESVEWLRQNDEALAALRRALRSLGGHDLEHVISFFSHEPKTQTLRTMEQRIDSVTGLWMLLRAVAGLEAALRAQLFNHREGSASSGTASECSDDEMSLGELSPPRHKRRRSGSSSSSKDTFSPPYHSSNTERYPKHLKCNGATLLSKLLETLTVCRMDDICSEMGKYLDENVIHATWQQASSRSLAQLRSQPQRSSQNPSQKQEQLFSNPKQRANSRVIQVQRCFAVQQNLSGTLDAARHTYTQAIDAMFSHVDEVRKRTGVGSLQLAYDGVREYHLYYDARHEGNAPDDVFLHKYSGGAHYALYHNAVLHTTNPPAEAPIATPPFHPHALASSRTLPARAALTSRASSGGEDTDDENEGDEAVQDEQRRSLTRHQVRGRRVTCTTSELLVLRRTATDTVTEILRTQNDLVRSLVDYLRQRLGKLQAVCDAVAMLDLLVAFTMYARLHDCTCPALLGGDGDGDGGTHFTDARHPGGVGAANTIRWDSGGACLLLVTGPNASGKTTLLRQAGQLVALAQSGCPVPARSAALQPCDRLIAHMLCDDLDDTSISSFGREMRELSYLCLHATHQSFVLVDELGRRTTVREGTGIAWATAEFLVDVRCRTLFVTHFGPLTRLAAQYPRDVANYHLAVAAETPDGSGAAGESATAPRTTWRLRFEYRLCAGPCEVDHYGLRLAAHIGFFEPVLALAEMMMKNEEVHKKGAACEPSRLSGLSNMTGISSVSLVSDVSAASNAI